MSRFGELIALFLQESEETERGKMDGGDRMRRRKSFHQRLGLKSMVCCGSAWSFGTSVMSVRDEEDENDVVESVHQQISSDQDDAVRSFRQLINSDQNDVVETIRQQISSDQNDVVSSFRQQINPNQNDVVRSFRQLLNSDQNDVVESLRQHINSDQNDVVETIRQQLTSDQNDVVETIRQQINSNQNDVVESIYQQINSDDPECTFPSPRMNLAAALAAERQFRSAEMGGEDVEGTPLRVSLMRLLEETEMEGEDEEEGLGGDQVCCVCMGRKKGAALIPCGHTYCRVCCRELWLNRGSCPLCNRSILEILDIY